MGWGKSGVITVTFFRWLIYPEHSQILSSGLGTFPLKVRIMVLREASSSGEEPSTG